MLAIRPALFDAPLPARLAAILTILGLLLLPWTLTLPDSMFGAWWVLTLCLPALVTVVLAPRETWDSLREFGRQRLQGVTVADIPTWMPRRLLLPRAGAGAVRVRLRRAQGVRMKRRLAA